MGMERKVEGDLEREGGISERERERETEKEREREEQRSPAPSRATFTPTSNTWRDGTPT